MSSSSTRWCTLEVGSGGIDVDRMDEVAAIAAVAHTVEVVVRTVRERTAGFMTGDSTLRSQNDLAGNQLRWGSVVGRHHLEHLASGKSFMSDVVETAPRVVDVDGLGDDFRVAEVSVNELAGIAHGTGFLVASSVLAAEDQARDLEMSWRKVMDGLQWNGHKVLEVRVVNGKCGCVGHNSKCAWVRPEQ